MSLGITIVGLGPGYAGDLTLEAWRILEHAPEIYLRTRQHPTVAALPATARIESFDDLYASGESFAAVYEAIAQAVIELGKRPQGVIYAVPGHPLVGEATVPRISELARQAGLEVHIVAGVSSLEAMAAALGIDPFDGLQLCDATLLAQHYHPNLDPDVPTLIVQLYSRHLAGQIKLTLMNLYPDEHPVRLVMAAGTAAERVRALSLYQIDRCDGLDHLTSLYLPPLAQPGSLATYQDIVARLRSPEGCPWDREQTHTSLRRYLLEETYEVLDALDADDMPALEEELGDLLLQVLLHAQIATEESDFKLTGVIQHIIAKLIRRHPHVFGSNKVDTADQVTHNWEQIKRQERGQRRDSMLDGIPRALPALSQAAEMQRRAARVGFDWPSIKPVVDKTLEELHEFQAASNAQERMAELGDLLFSLANLARHADIDPESALREANLRFARRFHAIERHAAEAGLALEEMTLEQMDAVWERAKQEER